MFRYGAEGRGGCDAHEGVAITLQPLSEQFDVGNCVVSAHPVARCLSHRAQGVCDELGHHGSRGAWQCGAELLHQLHGCFRRDVAQEIVGLTISG